MRQTCLMNRVAGFFVFFPFPTLPFSLFPLPDHLFRTRFRRTAALEPQETFRGQGNPWPDISEKTDPAD